MKLDPSAPMKLFCWCRHLLELTEVKILVLAALNAGLIILFIYLLRQRSLLSFSGSPPAEPGAPTSSPFGFAALRSGP
jgi:hypothetical protein